MTFTCKCGAAASTASNKKPRGWQGKGNSTLCPKCRKKTFEIRAIRFSVSEICGLSSDQRTAFYAELKRQHRLCTIAANAVLEECRRADAYVTEATMEAKMPKFTVPSVDGSWAYQLVRKTCPSLNTGCAASIARAVVSDYTKQRFESRWTFAKNALSIKSFPLLIRAQEAGHDVRVVQMPVLRDGKPVLDGLTRQPVTQPAMLISLPVGKVRYDFRLWKEPKFDPNFEAFKHLVAGRYELRAVEIGWAHLKNRANTDAPNSMVQNYRDGAKNKRSQKLQLKLIVQRPKATEAVGVTGTMVVRTDRNSFVVAAVEEGRLWRLTENRLKRQVASLETLWDRVEAYRLERLALSDDKKFRSRQSDLRHRIDARLKTKEQNHANWIKNWIENAVAEIKDYALRSRVARVEYDDAEKSFLPSFQWFKFKQRLSDALTNAGIEFLEMSPDDEESLQRPGEGKSKTRNGAGPASSNGTSQPSGGSKQPGRKPETVAA